MTGGMERGERHTVRGRTYENGPYSCCDRADIHPLPCTCAMPPVRPLADVLRDEVLQWPSPGAGCYWPIEDAEPPASEPVP